MIREDTAPLSGGTAPYRGGARKRGGWVVRAGIGALTMDPPGFEPGVSGLRSRHPTIIPVRNTV